jgi:hypothetical protein
VDITERISQTPNHPAIYAIYGGRGGKNQAAYIGISGNLRRRIEQHLEKRNSSVTAGESIVGLNPAFVTRIDWWTDPSFENGPMLEAAELIAFELFNPVLRSRGGNSKIASELASQCEFSERMRRKFAGEPDGRLIVPTLQDALDRIAALEARIVTLEESIGSVGANFPEK